MKDSSGNIREKNIAFSLMRICASFAIVLLHTVNVSEILYRDTLTKNEDLISMAGVYCLMWAVPMFIMVSGALLLDPKREITLKRLYGKYIFRVAGALIVFVFFFRFFDMVMNREAFSFAIIGEAFHKMVTGTSWAHLWYLYVLIGIYVLLPAYRGIAAACDEKTGKYLFIVFTVFLSILPVLEAGGIKIEFHLQITAVYSLYFLAGFLFDNNIVKINRKTAIAFTIIGTAGSIGLCIGRYYGTVEWLDDVLGSYASPFVVLQSVGLFILLRDVFGSNKQSRMIDVLDQQTFGIYLIHMVFLRLFLRYMNWNLYHYGAAAFVFFVIGMFALSFGIVFLLRCIPGVKRIL